MIKFLPYILKTLWRHRSRTMITVSGSAVALFVFCFVGAVQQGMNDLERNQESRQSLILFQANKFCPFTSHLPQDYEAKIQKLDGVREVVPIQVFTNNCRASLDVIVFYGVPPKKLRTARDFDLVAGNWSDFEQHQDAAVVGRAVASRRGLHPGDKFSIGDLTVQVAGIFKSHDPAEENYIYSHLDFLQRRNKQDLVGTVTQHEVLLAPGVDPNAKAQQIDAMFRGGPVATDTRPKGVFQAKSLGDLTQLIHLARYLAYACVGLVLALVTTTTLMSVQDRIQEHAILQTLGFTGARFPTSRQRERVAEHCRRNFGCRRRHARVANRPSFGRRRSGNDRLSAFAARRGRKPADLRDRRVFGRDGPRLACGPRSDRASTSGLVAPPHRGSCYRKSRLFSTLIRPG